MKQIIPIFSAIVENGKLAIKEKFQFNQWLKGLKGECEVIVRNRRKIRTLSQNSLYWVYLEIISQETGQDTESMHELFKKEFISAEKIEMFGKEAEKRKTTTAMSPIEFSDYIKKIEVLTGVLCPKKDKIEI